MPSWMISHLCLRRRSSQVIRPTQQAGQRVHEDIFSLAQKLERVHLQRFSACLESDLDVNESIIEKVLPKHLMKLILPMLQYSGSLVQSGQNYSHTKLIYGLGQAYAI